MLNNFISRYMHTYIFYFEQSRLQQFLESFIESSQTRARSQVPSDLYILDKKSLYFNFRISRTFDFWTGRILFTPERNFKQKGRKRKSNTSSWTAAEAKKERSWLNSDYGAKRMQLPRWSRSERERAGREELEGMNSPYSTPFRSSRCPDPSLRIFVRV